MRKIKARTLWIIVGILFILAVGLIFAIQYSSDILNKVLLVTLVIDFILITVLIQFASFKSFGKVRNIKYETIEYKTDISDIESELKKQGYKKTKRNYGASYIFIKDKHAYKIAIVSDSISYFSNTEENDNTPANKELDKCETFLGIEIFESIDEKNIEKLKEFTIQTKNIYYTAFVKMENGNYKCLNYEAPNEIHLDCYKNILEDLHFTQVEEV